jgi:hypothetical protein
MPKRINKSALAMNAPRSPVVFDPPTAGARANGFGDYPVRIIDEQLHTRGPNPNVFRTFELALDRLVQKEWSPIDRQTGY